MAAKLEDPLFAHFTKISGGDEQTFAVTMAGAANVIASWSSGMGLEGSEAAHSGNSTASLFAASGNAAGSSVQGLPLDTASAAAGNGVESLASTFLESGFGVAALIKGLLGLFGGGASAQQPIERYEMPSAIAFESAESAGALSPGSFDQNGGMRSIGIGENQGNVSSSGAREGNVPQIHVNVQAMDAQSFLDHSDQIAQAVRGAMLSMSSINDVVNDL